VVLDQIAGAKLPPLYQSLPMTWEQATSEEKQVLGECMTNAAVASGVSASTLGLLSFSLVKFHFPRAPLVPRVGIVVLSTVAGLLGGPLLTTRTCMESIAKIESTSELKSALVRTVSDWNTQVRDYQYLEEVKASARSEDL
jgi:hypothetical protein